MSETDLETPATPQSAQAEEKVTLPWESIDPDEPAQAQAAAPVVKRTLPRSAVKRGTKASARASKKSSPFASKAIVAVGAAMAQLSAEIQTLIADNRNVPADAPRAKSGGHLLGKARLADDRVEVVEESFAEAADSDAAQAEPVDAPLVGSIPIVQVDEVVDQTPWETIDEAPMTEWVEDSAPQEAEMSAVAPAEEETHEEAHHGTDEKTDEEAHYGTNEETDGETHRRTDEETHGTSSVGLHEALETPEVSRSDERTTPDQDRNSHQNPGSLLPGFIPSPQIEPPSTPSVAVEIPVEIDHEAPAQPALLQEAPESRLTDRDAPPAIEQLSAPIVNHIASVHSNSGSSAEVAADSEPASDVVEQPALDDVDETTPLAPSQSTAVLVMTAPVTTEVSDAADYVTSVEEVEAADLGDQRMLAHDDEAEYVASVDETSAQLQPATATETETETEAAVDTELAPARASTGAGWTIPLMCLGIGLVACCLAIPQMEVNRRLRYEQRNLQANLDSVEKQVAVNGQFLKKVMDDPTLAQRLAGRQLKTIPQGHTIVQSGQNNEDGDMSPFALVAVAPPPKPPEYTPVRGSIADLCNNPHSRLYVLGVAMTMVAIGLVMGCGKVQTSE